MIRRTLMLSLVVAVLTPAVRADQQANAPKAANSPSGKVYGEWLIRVKPDKGPEYNRLIEEKGLRQRFGESYEDYCSKVPRWIPKRPIP